MHVANNVSSFVHKVPRSWGWLGSVVHVAVCLVYAAIIVRMWRSRSPSTGARTIRGVT
jgi:hypothetical protein